MTPDEYCQGKAAASGSSFYYSFLFLPEGVAVGFQRVRGSAVAVGVPGGARRAQFGEQARRLVQEGVDQLDDEVGTRGRLQFGEAGGVDGGGHVMFPCVPARG